MSRVWLLVRLAFATGDRAGARAGCSPARSACGSPQRRSPGRSRSSSRRGAVTFAVGASPALTLVLVLAVGAAAHPSGAQTQVLDYDPHLARSRRWRVVAAGVVLGILLWHVAGEIGGDGLFHLARVRKLDALGDLSLDAVNEFPDGGLHPGLRVPALALVPGARRAVACADPSEVVLHEPSVLHRRAARRVRGRLGALPARLGGGSSGGGGQSRSSRWRPATAAR